MPGSGYAGDDGRSMSPSSNPSRSQIKAELSDMPGIPGLHPGLHSELLPVSRKNKYSFVAFRAIEFVDLFFYLISSL